MRLRLTALSAACGRASVTRRYFYSSGGSKASPTGPYNSITILRIWTGELIVIRLVVVRHGCQIVQAHVRRLGANKEGNGAIDAARSHLFAVDENGPACATIFPPS